MYHRHYGVITESWVPAPSYLLRRARILRFVDDFKRGSVLEIGCGAGALLHDLHSRGFLCSGVEQSEAAREMASEINPQTLIYKDIPFGRLFNYIMAFEVLEHIEDDIEALSEWTDCLRPGGLIMISVPAHRDRWGADDKAVGHYRRYDWTDIVALARKTGLRIVYSETWGWPLSNLIRPLRNLRYRVSRGSKKERTERSGIERSVESKLMPLLTNPLGLWLMRFFCFVQGLFCRTDFGNGFLVILQKY